MELLYTLNVLVGFKLAVKLKDHEQFAPDAGAHVVR